MTTRTLYSLVRLFLRKTTARNFFYAPVSFSRTATKQGLKKWLCLLAVPSSALESPADPTFMALIIYMKKFLDYDWLREMQFLGNTVQKKGNLVQKRVTNVTF